MSGTSQSVKKKTILKAHTTAYFFGIVEHSLWGKNEMP